MKRSCFFLNTCRQKSVVILAAVGFLLFSNHDAQAARHDTGTPTVYKVNIKKVQISKNGGITFTTVGKSNTPQPFDLASVSAGSVAGNFISGAPPLEPNTAYNFVRVVLTCTISILGNVNNALFTQAGTDVTAMAGPAVEGEYTIPAGTPGVGCNNNEFFAQGSVNPFLISDAAGGMSITISFNVARTLQVYAGSTLGPALPGFSITQQ